MENPELYQTILVCLDGSPVAEQILPFVKVQASQFKSKLILLKIIPLPTDNIIEAGATFLDAKMHEEQTQIHIDQATNYLESLRDRLKNDGFNAQAVVIKAAQIGQAIVKYAGDNHINLIAIATHGHGGLGKLVFGSIFEYVLKHSGLPLLVIKPQNV